MKNQYNVGYADRLKSAADARRSLLDRLQPRPTQTDPLHHEREGMRKARLAGVRAERATVRAAKRQAAADAVAEQLLAQATAEAQALALKRGARKERKALTAAEAKAKRDAKYAARKARG
ncbi:DUF6481 family protein [Phenylobacterium sp.]|jgi:hypothetical protein|uniref:DUF6481 family protein n=1 Tax=Phenylobacterium sp. TaxID=1871053 RepID=UPI003783F0AB